MIKLKRKSKSEPKRGSKEDIDLAGVNLRLFVLESQYKALTNYIDECLASDEHIRDSFLWKT